MAKNKPLNGEKTGRNEKGQFTKGNGGGGRKKIPEKVKEMLSEAAPGAVQLLIDTMKDDNIKPELRVSCANTIIERVFGKAAQPLEHSGEVAAMKIILEGELDEWAT